jgi:hypothetical protein
MAFGKIGALTMTNESPVGCPSFSVGQLACDELVQGLVSAHVGSGLADRTSAAEEAPK